MIWNLHAFRFIATVACKKQIISWNNNESTHWITNRWRMLRAKLTKRRWFSTWQRTNITIYYFWMHGDSLFQLNTIWLLPFRRHTPCVFIENVFAPKDVGVCRVHTQCVWTLNIPYTHSKQFVAIGVSIVWLHIFLRAVCVPVQISICDSHICIVLWSFTRFINAFNLWAT